ncbi:hypothetical protein [Phycicoccus jejuensis]|uniref:hypothetical protein n=1 Tax=Phycicoccus jejuensis TaxID=367299 RepID=UPI00146FD18E|nr:hypothetical protein [Phycicoccus jejuensis]
MYPLTGRFADECAVGVDGFCIGEPVQDSQIPLPDVRWYRLRHRDDYVAAAKLFALSPERELGAKPEDSCPAFARTAKLARAPVTKRLKDGTLGIEAAPQGTPMVGFALAPVPNPPGEPPVEQLGRSPRTAENGTVRIRLNPKVGLSRGLEAELVAVVACLAPSAPSRQGSVVLRVDLSSGQVTPASPSSDLLQRLQFAACRVDPNLPNDQLQAAAAHRSF